MAKTKENDKKAKVVDNTNVEVVEETKKETTKSKKIDKSKELYYFYSVGCGWCKRTEPHIDALNKEGYNILKLDLANGDNQKISQELKTKYNVQCGTPWLIDPETGNQICGFREKDVIEKWANGEEIPAPPRPKGPMPRPPFEGVSDEELNKWKEDYAKWADENSHLPKIQTADEILARPRPKSEPPKPPQANATDEELEVWGKEYTKWAKENDHLPNVFPADKMIERFKQRRNGPGAPGAPGAPQVVAPTAPTSNSNTKLNFDQRLSLIEDKVNKVLDILGG